MRLYMLILILGVMCVFPSNLTAGKANVILEATSEESSVAGAISFHDTDEGLTISGEISGVSEGSHGFHIHEFGSCEENGKAAGSHFNPNQVTHGNLITDGLETAHAGDLGNVSFKEDGIGIVELVVPHLSIDDSKLKVANLAVILHEKTDDFSQPTGNAGGRIGCGVITVTEE